MNEDFEPVIIGFMCNWCTYRAADLAGTARLKYKPNVKPVRVMCSSRVDPILVMNALLSGADGVLVAGCHPGECHYQTGNLYTRRRMMLLKELLGAIGIDPHRLRLEWVSASEGTKFVEVVDDFIAEIKALGPNPVEAVLQ